MPGYVGPSLVCDSSGIGIQDGARTISERDGQTEVAILAGIVYLELPWQRCRHAGRSRRRPSTSIS